MKRSDLEHVIRAAGAITGITEWVVVGSQAILGAVPEAPPSVLVSQEADIYAPADESASDLVDGSIGEKSPFHESFGYYAHGVGPRTAILPSRWRARATTIRSGEVIAICPHPSDLVISKLAAGREKDLEFVRALLEHRITTSEEIRARFDELDRDEAARVAERLRSVTAGRT